MKQIKLFHAMETKGNFTELLLDIETRMNEFLRAQSNSIEVHSLDVRMEDTKNQPTQFLGVITYSLVVPGGSLRRSLNDSQKPAFMTERGDIK